MDLAEIGALLAQACAAELTPRFTRVAAAAKADGSLVTEADTALQARLVAELAQGFPGWPVLGEEMDPGRQQAILDRGGTFWCLDPLDGTTNFAAGAPYYAVSLALVEAGRVSRGWVYDPQRGECFQARRGHGAWCNDAPLRPGAAPAALADCVALVDFKRLGPNLATRLATRPPYRSQRSFGAVALDWCWLAAGRCHLYLHGQMNLWDYAAGALIAAEAGARVCLVREPGQDCDTRLGLGRRSGVGAVSDELFAAWREVIRGAG
jgi:myo-inositol-1(or 4)-monophosphatase